MGAFRDLTGQRFGKLVVVECVGRRSFPGGSQYIAWKCKCDCGNEAIVSTSSLKNERHGTKSCGCLKIANNGTRTHGLSKTKLYQKYRNMVDRCYKESAEKYSIYGARGIKVCDEWRDKKSGRNNFLTWALNNGYSDGLTLDRIDVNGDYCPENCRWTDSSVQSFNRRQFKSKTGIRGVAYREKYNRYEPHISYKGKQIYLGIYYNLEDAIKARKEAEWKYYGQILD